MAGQVQDDDLEVVIPPSQAGGPPPTAPALPPAFGLRLPDPVRDVPTPTATGGFQGNTDVRAPGLVSALTDLGGRAIRTLGPPALEVGLGVAGAYVPGGGLVSRAIGAGVGQAVGTAARPLVGAPPPSLEEVGWSGAAGMAGEVGPTAAFGAVRGARNVVAKAPSFLQKHGAPEMVVNAAERVRAPFAPWVKPEAREALDRGIDITPGMATDLGPVRVIENVVQGSLTSDKYRKALTTIGEQFSESTQQEMRQFGRLHTPEALGRRVQAGIQHAERASRRTANEAYEHVWKLADDAGTNVSINPIRQYSAEELAKRGLAADVTSGKGIRFLRKVATGTDDEAQAAKELGEAANYVGKTPQQLLEDPRYTQVVEAIANRAGVPVDAMNAVDNQIPFRAAHYLRSAANDLAHEAGRTGDYQTAYLARQVHARLDESMETAAESAPGLRDSYKRATKLWRDLRETYSEGIVADIVKADPHMVLKQLEPHTVKPVRDLRDTLGPKAWAPVQRALAEDIVEDASKITNNLHKWGKETLAEIFPRGTADGLFQLGRIADLIGAKGPGTGKVWIELTQAGAFAGLLVGKQPGKAATVLLGPHVLGRIVLSPTGRQLLTTGLKEKAAGNVGAASRAASQLVAWAVKERILDVHQPATTPGPAQATLPAAPTTGRGAGPGPRGGGPPSVPDDMQTVIPPQ